MKSLSKQIFTLLILILMMICPTSAWSLDGLQVMELKGRLVDSQGRELAEYDYLEPDQKYRLMPGTDVELSSLDGSTSWQAKGPGIITFDKSGRVTLNGKVINQGQVGSSLAGTTAAGGNRVAAVSMRGRDGVKVITQTAGGGTKAIRLYSGYHALVIGCSDYRQGWPHLPNPIKDAREVAGLLKSLDWKVQMVTNPTGRQLRKAFNSLITGPGKDRDKAILVWFSGHGHTLEEVDGSRLGYIVPVDAPDPAIDEMGFMEAAMSMRQVETVARRVMSKHVMMMFDSCFSGALFSITRAKPSAFIEEKVAKPVRQFVTAGNENEEVPDKSHFKTVFIQGVGEGYADRNKDGYITGQELGSYLQEQVVNYSRKAQHPQYGKINNPKLDKGDFVFAMKAEPEPAPPPALLRASVKPPQEARVASVQRSVQPAPPKTVKEIEEPEAVDYRLRRVIMARVRKWSRDAVNLDAGAMAANLTSQANMSVKIKGNRINTNRSEYLDVLRMQARRFKGQFKREILKVMGLEVMGTRAKVALKTKVVAPGGGVILIERLDLKEKDGSWLISKYRFSKLGNIQAGQQATEKAVSSGVDPQTEQAILARIKKWNTDLVNFDKWKMDKNLTRNASMNINLANRGLVMLDRSSYLTIIQKGHERLQGRVSREILEVLSLNVSGNKAKVSVKIKIEAPHDSAIRREELSLAKENGSWLISKCLYKERQDLDAVQKAESSYQNTNDTDR